MGGILDTARRIPHRFLPRDRDYAGGQLTANRVVEQKSGIDEALKGSCWDETVLVQAAEKRSADSHLVRGVAERRS
jgi:hypothetical protein